MSEHSFDSEFRRNSCEYLSIMLNAQTVHAFPLLSLGKLTRREQKRATNNAVKTIATEDSEFNRNNNNNLCHSANLNRQRQDK